MLGVSAVALILAFGFGQLKAAQIVITVMGSGLALMMLWDMIQTLRSGKFGIDLLAITAVVATLAVGEYWAAMIVLLMLTGGDALEDFAAHKAKRELKSLLDQAPTKAHRQETSGLNDVQVDDVAVGDILVVKPGEQVPVDGVVIEGESMVNEASLTGESKPIEKGVSAELMSGTINGDVALTMKVTKTAADSQYQGIVRLVKESEAKPARFVRMADRYAVPFTLVAYLIAGVAWWLSGDPVRFAQVLVVASPCPLILAAPIALVSGMSRTSRHGIIVKSGTTLEKLASAKTFAFDKTGTITSGVLHVTQVKPVSPWREDQLLQLAASAEQQSTHILARSLVTALPKTDLLAASDVSEVTGMGVSAKVAQHTVKVGKAKFAGAADPVTGTAVYVNVDGQYAGVIILADHIRPEANATMRQLHTLGAHQLMMISGDQQAIADQIAEEAGIDQVYAEQLPAQKIAVLAAVPAKERPVVMVGDGVNDAPSLATADVGIAMGAHGATAASESADAVILPDDLSKVAEVTIIARDTMVIAREAVLIGIAICTILMLIASFGVIPAIIGAMFQEVVDTVTILYALRARTGRTHIATAMQQQAEN
ncbi:cation transport ATPase [Lacticaseibacillus saniviri JCM 17471 = DSM 24301]|uniref:Cd(2+)-exporting ATPase n=1 Tax=Lacticaseibacillus saniviri JCM 17471 = DSM 24301 TaxID=1293598 RepID=A0A0R2MRS6_9LACO|nr:cation transport ATPase [Lacticaseibacillus saniviri JCM 17471 = DSM 24301]